MPEHVSYHKDTTIYVQCTEPHSHHEQPGSKHPEHKGNTLGSHVKFVQTEQLTALLQHPQDPYPRKQFHYTELGESKHLALQGVFWAQNPQTTKALLFIFQEGVGREGYTPMPEKKQSEEPQYLYWFST